MEISVEKILDFLKDNKEKDFIIFLDKPYLVTVGFGRGKVYVKVDGKDVLVFDKKEGKLIYEERCKIAGCIRDIVEGANE